MRLLWSPVLPLMIFAGVALVGCGDDDEPEIGGSAWQLTEIGGVAASTEVVATLDLGADGVAAGTTGCNSFNGSYETDGQSISFGPLAATRALCASDELNAQETAYLAALGAAAGWSIDADVLTLSDGEGTAVATFTSFAPTLEGAWAVTSVNDGAEAVVSVIIGTEITLDFADGSTVSGNGGCNDYSGTYVTDESAVVTGPLTIEPLSATERACSEPEGIMQQEAQYLAALEAADTWQRNGSRLELRDAGGALQVSAEPAG